MFVSFLSLLLSFLSERLVGQRIQAPMLIWFLLMLMQISLQTFTYDVGASQSAKFLT
jgi:hypothetical protein